MKCDIGTFLDGFKENPKKTRFMLCIAIAGILLIMLSDIMPDKSRDNEPTSEDTLQQTDQNETYRLSTQMQLKHLLEQINGVGRCSIMVMTEGTTEYVYAENISRYTDTDGVKTSDKFDNNIVFTEKDGDKQALVKKVIKPQISGVVVVCEGGGDIRIKERVIKAVSTALDISSAKVCVEERK